MRYNAKILRNSAINCIYIQFIQNYDKNYQKIKAAPAAFFYALLQKGVSYA